MSALLEEDDRADPGAGDREAERSMVTVYPLQTVFARKVWTMDSYALPIPALARRVVRDGVSWRLAVHAAIQHYQPPDMGKAERAARAEEYKTFLATLVYLGPDHDEFAKLMLHLFPVARCAFAGCRGPYLRYSARMLHCSDECRRAAAGGPGYGTGVPRGNACAVCGGTLADGRRRYCGARCARLAENEAARVEEGRRLPPPLSACAICGAPVAGRRRRYCRDACRETAENDARAERRRAARDAEARTKQMTIDGEGETT